MRCSKRFWKLVSFGLVRGCSPLLHNSMGDGEKDLGRTDNHGRRTAQEAMAKFTIEKVRP